MNHAAWVLGHLAYVFDSMVSVWDQKPAMSAEWKALFNVPSKPQPQREIYPSKAELWDAYQQAYQRIVDVVKNCSDEEPEPRISQPALAGGVADGWSRDDAHSHFAPGATPGPTVGVAPRAGFATRVTGG